MASQVNAPAPRDLVIGTTRRGREPVDISREWLKFLLDFFARSGGTMGASADEIQAAIAALVAESDAQQTQFHGAMARLRKKATVEVTPDVLSRLLARVARLEKRVKDIEGAPL